MATIGDVANEAHVSQATVSRVINGGKVRDETKRRVIRAIRRLDYQPNAQARGLTSGKTGVVGVIVPSMGSAFYGPILEGIQETLLSHGLNLMICSTYHRCGNEWAFTRMLAQKRIDGLIFITPREITGDGLNRLLSECMIGAPPVIVADGDIVADKVSVVGFDNVAGGYKAVTHLISLGHRRIGLLLGAKGGIETMQRLHGYEQALIDAEFDGSPDLVVTAGSYEVTDAIVGAELLLPSNPTAIFACSDELAMGVFEVARKRGLRIPEDISVIGYDDVSFAQWMVPKLTTIRLPKENLGKIVAQRMVSLIHNEQTDITKTILPIELVVRDSTQRRDA